MCATFNDSFKAPNFTRTEMYVDDRLNYIYCLISKVSCTSWKRVTLMLTGRMRVNRTADLSKGLVHYNKFSDRFLDRLQMYTPKEIAHRMKNYFKFMFVRHPFERIVSAYRDKFVRKNVYQKYIGRYIVRNYRRNPTAKAVVEGTDVTFEEFVRYLLDPKTRSKRPFDRHWLSFHETCHPCYMHYDFIGKFETLQEDAAYVIKRLGGGVEFPDEDPDNKWKGSSEYVAVIKNNISAESYLKLKELYALDYFLFEYS